MTDKKILMVVDDDKDDRYFFGSAVRKHHKSYECREATEGADALDQLRRAETLPDFIFLDLNMPLMDGKTCLKELKKDRKLKDIPVMVYSTSDHHKDIQETMILGAVHYLVKLHDIYMLPEAIMEAIKIAEEKLKEKAA
jgi:CheY-like chemotaxis protein